MDPAKSNMDGNSHSQLTNSAKAAGTVRPAGSVAWVASGLGPRICFAPEGAAGGIAGVAGAAAGAGGDGGAAADKGASGADGTAAGGEGGAADGADGGNQKPQRPEWLPETLWDADAGFKAKDYDDLVAFRAERSSAEAARPESADAYEVALPESFKLPDHIKLAEGQQIVDPADPRVVELRKIAHDKGWSQQDFQDVLALGVNLDIAGQDRHVENLKAEFSKLGSRAQQRVDAVTGWLGAKLGKLAPAVIDNLLTAEQVQAFETIMSLNRGSVPGTPGAGRDTGNTEISDEEYDKMSPSAKINYARQHGKK